MEQVLEQRIRLRAYQIWEAVGRPDGDSDRHWLAAEREVLAASVQPMIRPAANKKAPARKSPRQAKPAKSNARKIA
jgi:Protein of unknown function (DUF2934)